MLAIYKRELKSSFCSFTGFLFMGIALFLPGLYFTVYCLLGGYPYYSYVVSGMGFLFLFSVPVLTMRTLAEEKKNKTDQLILTAPVSVGAIVMGKFLALVTIFAIPTLITCVYPLILTRFGTVPLGENYMAILGFFLYGMTCIALGVLISSLTESQVIAAVLSFGVLFLGYMMNALCSLISQSGNLLTKILGCFDIYTPMENLLNGTLNISSVVYFLSLTALLLFLTTQSIQKRRYSVSTKHLSLGAYSGASIAIAIAIVVAVNMVFGEMPSTWTAIDLTSQKLYSLTDQTREFLKGLQEDVTIYVIVNEDDQNTFLGQTLQYYEDSSDHITVEYVDPAINPTFHTQYTSQNISLNSMIVVSEKRSKVIDASDVFQTSYDYYTGSSTITGYDGEGLITSALDYVTTDHMPKVYITEGHGEYELSSSFEEALDKENVEYENITLLNLESVPDDAACLFINGPLNDFNSDDKDKVIQYLERGGNVVVVVPMSESDLPNFNEILAYMGLQFANGLVVEETQGNYYQSPYYLFPTINSSRYTIGIYGYSYYYIFAPYSMGLQITDEAAEGMTYSTFLETSDNSYAKMDMSDLQSITKGDEDVDGPFQLGVEAVKTIENTEEDGTVTSVDATMIAIGCDQIFTDSADQVVSGANRLLFTNIMGSFSDHEMSVSIPVKSYEVSNVLVTQPSLTIIGGLVTVVLPLAFLVIGFVIWFRRRKR